MDSLYEYISEPERVPVDRDNELPDEELIVERDWSISRRVPLSTNRQPGIDFVNLTYTQNPHTMNKHTHTYNYTPTSKITHSQHTHRTH